MCNIFGQDFFILKSIIKHDAFSVFKHKYSEFTESGIFWSLLLRLFELLRFWLSDVQFEVRAQVCEILLDFWPVTMLFLHFNSLGNWPLILHQCSNAHRFYVHRIFFITFYWIAFKVAIWNSCWIKRRRGERLSAICYNASVLVFTLKINHGEMSLWNMGSQNMEHCFALYDFNVK